MSNFKHIQQFETLDPAKLGRQLSELEDSLDGALNRVREASSPLLANRIFVPTQASPISSLGPDEQLTVDTSFWNALVVLPDLAPANFGRRFVLIKALIGANTIAVSCRNPTVLCNGGAFPVLTGPAGVTTFYCNKYGYYT